MLIQLEAANANYVRDWILSVAGQPSAAAFAGHLFESYAHRAICAGGVFASRPLLPNGSGSEVPLSLPPSTRFSFRDTSMLGGLSAGQYAVPTIPNLTAGDSLALHSANTLFIFQCTVSSHHSLVAHGIEELVAQFPSVTTVCVYFVVPDSVFAAWTKPQTYVTKSKGTPCVHLPACFKMVTQHVLCVSLAGK